jgi:hypothetical protein
MMGDMLGRSRRRLPLIALVGVGFHILFLAAAPFEHHDLICHLKTPQHCTSCASNPLGSESRICPAPGACRLADAGRIFALDALPEGALLAVSTYGRSPPSFA